MVGEPVRISCLWSGQHNRSRVKVHWLKEAPALPEEERLLKKDLVFDLNESHLHIQKFALKDAGKYVCMVTVEIPEFRQGEGAGTSLEVKPQESEEGPAQSSPDWQEVLISVLRYLPFLTLLLTFFYLNRRGIKPQQHKPAAPTNEPTSAQRGEEGEEEGGVRGIEDDAVDGSCLVEEAPTQEVHNSEQEGERK
ncbi:uncharacterized protein LOC144537862 [Centroberyx gerrardi]